MNLRKLMLETLHFTYNAAKSMIRQCKRKIFWPGMKKHMQTKYEECEQCQEHKASQATPHNQVSSEDIFKNFMPGQRCRYTTQKKEMEIT